MGFWENMAAKIAGTGFGRRALEEGVDWSAFRTRPTPRIYAGIFLISLSCAAGIPGIILCGWLANKHNEPLILLLGGGALTVMFHAVFAAGAWLAGSSYVGILFRWSVRKFIMRFPPSV